MLSKDQWRLGHKRPWWQWNVLTLFAALFVLVWLRELLNISYGGTLAICGGVVLLWLVLPMPSLGGPPAQPYDNLRHVPSPASAKWATWLALVFLVVLVLGASLLRFLMRIVLFP